MLVKKKNSIYYIVMFFLLVMIGVGYAYFNTTISINGSTALAKNTWDVHFENAIVTDGSVESESSIEFDSSSTVVKFSARLDLPGDFYEFTIDVVNKGTMDAMLEEVVKSELSEVQAEYLTYNVSYADGFEIKRNDKLAAGNKETIIVRVEYIEDTTSTVVEESDQYLELSLSLLYTQYSKTVYSQNSLIGRMAKEAVPDNVASEYVTSSTGINFSYPSSDTNGKGVYIRSGTENDRNPIYYYRGDINDNNVRFAKQCWKIVRTTDTGGVKMIYNGKEKHITEPIEESEYNVISNGILQYFFQYTFDTSTKKWTSTNKNDNTTSTISFSVQNDDEYVLNYTVSSESCCDRAIFYLDGTEIGNYGGDVSGTISLGKLTASNVIMVQYDKDGSSSNGTDSVSFSIERVTGEITCNNTGKESQLENTSYFSSSARLNVGYMYGKTYSANRYDFYSNDASGIVFGNDVIYENGVYTLIDTHTVQTWNSSISTIQSKYHYTCLNTEEKCEHVKYIYTYHRYDSILNYGYLHYIILSNGEKVSDFIDAMLINPTDTNDSSIKNVIDNWYSENINTYTNKLEDTIWCNDRSIYKLGLYNKDGTGNLTFQSSQRLSKSPSLECARKKDSFTVSDKNGNGKLTYPVALLTADEVVLAGAIVSGSGQNTLSYLHTGNSWWTLTPESDPHNYIYKYWTDNALNTSYSYSSYGVRPAISLSLEAKLIGGDGTPENPYIVE